MGAGIFPEWTWIVGLMVGATIGSFLNVVIYRLPRRMSLGNPRNSFCPNCKNQLGGPDLIPLFSWLTSKGKCRHCGIAVPSRYFWVELVTGCLWAAIWYRYFCYEGGSEAWKYGCAYAIGAAALVSIIFIDGEHYIIPDEINAFLLLVGVVFHLIQGTMRDCLVGYLVGWGIIFGIAFLGRVAFGKDAMGHGDIKMMRGVGALIGGVLTVFSVGIAVIAGLVFGLLFMALAARKGKAIESDVSDATGTTEEEDYKPESIKDLLILGISYLFCVDILAIWFPQVYTKFGYPVEDFSVEDDDWEPSLSTIPFGPYLAIGALVCILFKADLLEKWTEYLRTMQGPAFLP